MRKSGPVTGMQRVLFRAPVLLYRLGLGGVLGHRVLLLTHVGRSSGLPRRTVLEVVGRAGDAYLVPSGYGSRAQWFRNVLAEPRVQFQVGCRRYTGRAEPLPAAESGRRLATYAGSHPRAAAALMRMIGHEVDGSAEAFERLGADREHGIPLVALRPS